MLTYDEMRVWCKWHRLILNRMQVLYVITGDRVRVQSKGIRYWVEWHDSLVAEWRAYDLESVRMAFERVDAVEHFAWEVRRQNLAWC